MIYRIKKASGEKPKLVYFNRLAPFAGNNAGAHVREIRPATTEMELNDFVATYCNTAKAIFGETREKYSNFLRFRMNTRWHTVSPDN